MIQNVLFLNIFKPVYSIGCLYFTVCCTLYYTFCSQKKQSKGCQLNYKTLCTRFHRKQRRELQRVCQKRVSKRLVVYHYTGKPEGGGRSDYLRARKSLAPSEKFNFQACSSWDYGWSIAQFQSNYKV